MERGQGLDPNHQDSWVEAGAGSGILGVWGMLPSLSQSPGLSPESSQPISC